jgi:enoyl-CoA hydratase
MSDTTVVVETRERVGLVHMNRPEAHNALSAALLADLMGALQAFDEDPSVGAMVVTGSDRSFSVGADIKELAGLSAGEMVRADRIAAFDRLQSLHKPVVAAVSGWCLGGGFELALGCDMIVAADTARFGLPEVTIGVIPGAGGTQRLTRVVGKALAMEIVLNNRTLTAAEAMARGLVNQVHPVEAFLEAAVKLGNELAGRAPLAVRIGKDMVRHAQESFLTQGVADERQAFHLLFATEDRQEGMSAFLEKRPARWKGT